MRGDGAAYFAGGAAPRPLGSASRARRRRDLHCFRRLTCSADVGRERQRCAFDANVLQRREKITGAAGRHGRRSPTLFMPGAGDLGRPQPILLPSALISAQLTLFVQFFLPAHCPGVYGPCSHWDRCVNRRLSRDMGAEGWKTGGKQVCG